VAISKGQLGGGGAPFFKPADHLNDAALIIEPRSIRKAVQSTNGPRDEVTAYVTAFRNETSLEEGRAYFTQLATFTNKVLTRDLEKVLDQAKKDGDEAPAVIVRIKQWTPKGGGNKAWVLEELTSGTVFDGALAYYDKREAELAKAIDSAPDFD
jgi:hypothetical protein